MLTQEEYMDLLAMSRAGLTIGEIALELGYHPATISKWIQNGGPPAARVFTGERVVDARWEVRLNELLGANPKLLAKSLFEIVAAEGFPGSYPTVVRWVRDRRGPRFRAAEVASVPIETAPGKEAQFDWSDCGEWVQRWGFPGELWCFGVILSWSRWRRWWFTASTDRHHTFEGLVRFFEAAGGVPAELRTDRMGALGRSQGRRFRLYPPTLEFARHHGAVIRACEAGDAKRKGKVERPFRDLSESFLEELEALGPPRDLDELNRRAEGWLAERFHARPHRTTGVPPAARLEVERGLLQPLPRHRFDTAYAEPRRVHVAVPLLEWAGARYSVPPECLGQLVEVRREVGSELLVVRWGGREVARHRLAERGAEVWEPTHRQAAEAAALARHGRRHLRLVSPAEPASQPPPAPIARLDLDGDYDVEVPDLGRYALGEAAGEGCGCLGRRP